MKKPAAKRPTSSSPGKVREFPIALLGQKFMGKAHSNAWSQVARFFDLPLEPVMHTVAARDAAELTAFARRWGWRNACADWRQIAQLDEVRLVDIGTPNHLHKEQALCMLQAGKHVACEKPLAATLDEARVMHEAALAARRKGQQTFVWFNYRRVPAIGLAWRLLREGKLGRVRHVRAHYLQEWGGPQTPMSWRFEKKLAGSGAHGDLNAHIVDLARFLVGEEIECVHGAVARTFIQSRAAPAGTKSARKRCDVDDSLLFCASFEGGATASFEASRLAIGHQNDNSIEINAEHGSLRFGFEDMNLLWLADGDGRGKTDGFRRIMCTTAGQHPWVEAWWPSAHLLGYEHGFVNMAADMLRQLAGKKPEIPLPDFEDAYQTQRVLEAALQSARKGASVRLDQVR